MDRVDFLKQIVGKTLIITKGSFSGIVAPHVNVTLDGEIRWESSSWCPQWDFISDIKAEQDMEDVNYTFYENGEQVTVTALG